ncbi:MAG: hypothetical protein HYR80_08020 [Nitrospirae bacterium]|nr:hypothetical protein [Nitrospirota bacterium]
MNCPKCNGFMLYENFFDYLDDTGKMSFQGWRCVACGKILDPIIDSNRKNKTHVFVSRARRKFNHSSSGV